VGKAGSGAADPGWAQQWLLADWLKEWIEREAPRMTGNVYKGLLHAALARVDWHEVAGRILEGCETPLGDGQPERGECPV